MRNTVCTIVFLLFLGGFACGQSIPIANLAGSWTRTSDSANLVCNVTSGTSGTWGGAFVGSFSWNGTSGSEQAPTTSYSLSISNSGTYYTMTWGIGYVFHSNFSPPSSSPTPTPTATPAYFTISGQVVLTGSSKYAVVGIYFNAGGGFSSSPNATATTDSSGDYSFTLANSLAGLPYKISAMQVQRVDGQNVPVVTQLSSGTVPTADQGGLDPTGTTGSVGATQGADLPMTIIDASGNVSQGDVAQSQVASPSGTSTVYTYSNAGGGLTSVAYGNSGTSSVTSSDIRALGAQESSELEKAIGQIALSGSMIAQQVASTGTGIITGLSGTVSGTHSPSPTPTVAPTPSPTPTPDFSGIQTAMQNAMSSSIDTTDTNVYVGPSVPPESSRASSLTSSFWIVHLGTYGTMDLNPLDNAMVAQFASFLRELIRKIIVGIVIAAAYRFIWDFSCETGVVPFGGSFAMKVDLADLAAVGSVSFGLAAPALMAAFWLLCRGLLSFLIYTLLAGLVSAPTIVGSLFDIQSDGGAPSSQFVVGGISYGANLWTWLNSQTGVVKEMFSLLDAFIPVITIISASVNIVGMRALGVFVLRLWVSIIRSTPVN